MSNQEFLGLIYLVLASLVGLVYTFNWVRHKMTLIVKEATRKQKIGVISIVFVMSTIGAPLSLYELWKDNKRK